MNPFTIVPELLLGFWKIHKDERYYRAAAAVAIDSYVVFLGTLGTVGAAMLAGGKQPAFSLATAFFAACIVTAGAVLKTLIQQGIWSDLRAYIPPELRNVIEGSDVTTPGPTVSPK